MTMATIQGAPLSRPLATAFAVQNRLLILEMLGTGPMKSYKREYALPWNFSFSTTLLLRFPSSGSPMAKRCNARRKRHSDARYSCSQSTHGRRRRRAFIPRQNPQPGQRSSAQALKHSTAVSSGCCPTRGRCFAAVPRGRMHIPALGEREREFVSHVRSEPAPFSRGRRRLLPLLQ